MHGNKACGINIAKPAEIMIQDNSICRNESSGINIEMGCNANIHGNGIYGNQKCGILVTGKGLIKENDVFCNVLSGFQICGPGDPQITENRVQCTKNYSVSIMENARGFVGNNMIYESEGGAVFQHPDSTTTVGNNSVIPVKADSRHDICIYNEVTKECRHLNPMGLMLDSPPPRPLIPDKDKKLLRPAVSQLSSASSGAANIVASITSCHGRSRFCVIS